MAASSSEATAAADLLIEHSKEENKELIVTMTTEGLGLDVRAGVSSSNSASGSPLPAKAEEETTPTPPESSSLSSENGTVTVATTEEESLSVLLRNIKAEREPGKRSDQVQDQLQTLSPDFNSQSRTVAVRGKVKSELHHALLTSPL